MDARIRRGPFGAKGHWMWLCPICQKIYGLSNDSDSLIIYILNAGKYLEEEGGYILNITEIQRLIHRTLEGETTPEDAEVLFTGEAVLQLAMLNKNLEAYNALMHKALFDNFELLLRNQKFIELIKNTVATNIDEILEEPHVDKASNPM
jgi:hypothetical protein